MTAIQAFIGAAILSLVFNPVARRIGHHIGAVDIPAARKVHEAPTPRSGGMAIFLSFSIIVLLAVLHGDMVNLRSLAVVFAGASVIFIVGLIDDIRGLKATTKLAFQVAVALFMIYWDVRITLFLPGRFIGSVLTILWVVGITNAFNLLDNMNGLSAGVAVVASLLFLAVTVQQGLPSTGIVAAALAGALLGFMRYNYPHASIFMGDAGSLTIGYLLASISVMGTYVIASRLRHLPVITPVLILAVPIFDTLSVMYIRLRRGLPLFRADRNHLSHRLVDLGLSPAIAVMLVWLLSAAVGMSALLLPRILLYEALGIMLQAHLFFFIVVMLMYFPRNKQIRLEKTNQEESGPALGMGPAFEKTGPAFEMEAESEAAGPMPGRSD